MNRNTVLEFETSCTRRAWSVRPELRASKDGDTLTYDGYASVTETGYDVYGGPPYGWTETVAAGAFRKTLREGADVAFLVNHDGLTLARTKSGTLDLKEDRTGLRATAQLDARMNIVNDLQIAVERGDVDEMSFAFRVVKTNGSTGTAKRRTSWSVPNGVSPKSTSIRVTCPP
jgi:HK97 family phage prohead protease